MRLAFEAEGYFVLAASDAIEALALAGDYPGSIHVLVSDMQMPKLDGLGLRGRILKERPTIKTLMVSGRMLSAAEGVPFLQKPFPPAVLKARVRELLRSVAAATTA